jgi:cytochrome c oxidase subunit 4
MSAPVSSRRHRTGPEPPALRSNLLVLAALLVLAFFMRLKSDSPLLRLVAGAGFAWLALLIALSLADVLSRHYLLPPW